MGGIRSKRAVGSLAIRTGEDLLSLVDQFLGLLVGTAFSVSADFLSQYVFPRPLVRNRDRYRGAVVFQNDVLYEFGMVIAAGRNTFDAKFA